MMGVEFEKLRKGANQQTGREDTFVDLHLDRVDIETAVYEALGAASVCWDNLSGAGVFLSEHAENIGKQLMARINQALTTGD